MLSSDFQARVGALEPSVQGIQARVRDGDLLLELRVVRTRIVVVLGLIGEPFLRFSPAGVEANLASPTAGSARVIGAADAVSAPGVHWHLIRRGHVFAWHDNRLRPVPSVRDSIDHPRVVGSWSVPLIVDGRAVRVTGTEWYVSPPSPWPWTLAGALVVALAFLTGRRVSERAQRRLAGVFLLVAVSALMASWSGVILAGRATLPAELFAAAFAGVTGVFLFVGVGSTGGARQAGVMALIGAFVATFALPLITLFAHGFALSALPGVLARTTAAAAVVCGLAAAAVCAPAVKALLSVDGPRGSAQLARQRPIAGARRSRSRRRSNWSPR